MFLDGRFNNTTILLNTMDIKVRYEHGVFKPLTTVSGVREGQELEVHVEDIERLTMDAGGFDFLNDEPEIYTPEDIVDQ